MTPRAERQSTVDDNERRVREEYEAGRIDVDELERALEHVLAGGMGNARFPYLPVFEGFALEGDSTEPALWRTEYQ